MLEPDHDEICAGSRRGIRASGPAVVCIDNDAKSFRDHAQALMDQLEDDVISMIGEFYFEQVQNPGCLLCAHHRHPAPLIWLFQ